MALERLLENIIVDKTIDPKTMLIGDRNAVIIATRASGYGNAYETKTTCPSCGAVSQTTFDLSNPQIQELDYENVDFINKNEAGNFVIKLPQTQFEVEVRLLTGKDEQYLTQLAQNKRKIDLAILQ